MQVLGIRMWLFGEAVVLPITHKVILLSSIFLDCRGIRGKKKNVVFGHSSNIWNSNVLLDGPLVKEEITSLIPGYMDF